MVPVTDRGSRRTFLALPHRLYARDPAFVPTLMLEQRWQLDRRHNPHFEAAEIGLWLALRGDRPVGRISAQVDRLAQREGDSVGFFGHFDAENDQAAATALIETAEAWLRARGMTRCRGPFELSINERCGVLVEGFETPPMLMMPHGPAYLAALLEAAGYRGVRDLLAYHTPIEARMPTPGLRLMARLEGADVAVRPIVWRRYRDEIATVIDIFNDAWADNWGFVPLSGARLDHMARSLKAILDPELVAIAEVKGEPAAMLVALPNLNEALAGLDGRLLPLGWARLLWRLKVRGVRSMRVPLMGVRRKYHATLLGTAIMMAMFNRVRGAAHARGIREAELSWVLEENRGMRQTAERMGARIYKRYRIFEKELGG